MNASTPSAASHAPSRFVSGPSAALRVWSSTMLRGGLVVAAVGRDQGVQVRADDAHLGLQVVRLGEHGVERGARPRR